MDIPAVVLAITAVATAAATVVATVAADMDMDMVDTVPTVLVALNYTENILVRAK